MLNTEKQKILSDVCEQLEMQEIISDVRGYFDGEKVQSRRYIWTATGEQVGLKRIDGESVDFTDDD